MQPPVLRLRRIVNYGNTTSKLNVYSEPMFFLTVRELREHLNLSYDPIAPDQDEVLVFNEVSGEHAVIDRYEMP